MNPNCFVGTVIRLKGSIVCISFLDGAGCLLLSLTTVWRDITKCDDRTQEKRPQSKTLEKFFID